MSIRSWLLPIPTSTVNADTRRWLATEHDQHAEQTARERLAEWQQRATTEQAKARQLGREYGRASRTIHALRAEQALLREGLRQRDLDLRDEHSVNAELAQALDDTRPAPHPAWLGAELRRRWFAASDELTDGERWEQVAETAIDAVRGLWPLDHPTTGQAGCATAAVAGEPGAGTGELPASGVNYDEPLAEWEFATDHDADDATANTIADALLARFGRLSLGVRYGAAETAIRAARRQIERTAPQTSPGGEDTSSPQPGPSPSGDTTSDDVVCAFIHEAGCNGNGEECGCEPCCDSWPWCSSGTMEERRRLVMRTLDRPLPTPDVVAKAERYGDEIGQRAAAIGSATGLLRAHARDIGSGKGRVACFCGWGAEPPYRTMTDHAEHQARQLAAVGLLAIGGTP